MVALHMETWTELFCWSMSAEKEATIILIAHVNQVLFYFDSNNSQI